jgi:hypothetical protein
VLQDPELVVAADGGEDSRNIGITERRVDVGRSRPGTVPEKRIRLPGRRVDDGLQVEDVTQPVEPERENVSVVSGGAPGRRDDGDAVSRRRRWRDDELVGHGNMPVQRAQKRSAGVVPKASPSSNYRVRHC